MPVPRSTNSRNTKCADAHSFAANAAYIWVRTKALIGIGIAAAIGSIALAGASYAERGHGGMGFFAKGQFALMAMEIIESIDTDDDGKLSQAEIDKVRNDRHAAHDGDSDGNLSRRAAGPQRRRRAVDE